MVEDSPAKRSPPLVARLRKAHAAAAPFVLAPLTLSAFTGVSYRVLRDWLGWSRDSAHPLMTLHEGEWLTTFMGPQGETFYVVLNGLGLLWMLSTGSVMVWQRVQRWLAGRGSEGT